MNNFSTRDKAILIGLYLSKFDDQAISQLGFEGFNQAFNTLGYSIGVKPSSIKNYRDEFDPYFPNQRKGWHKRALREYCKKFLDEFGNFGFKIFTELVQSFVIKDYAIEKFIAEIEKKDYSKQIAKRLITGEAAEEYFKMNYQNVSEFLNFELLDTRKNACGFDYKVTLDSNYYCVEVKGLSSATGSISLTEKEFSVAQNQKEKFCLFIVSNFIEKPMHQYYFNPLESRLTFKKVEKQIVQITFNTAI
jgi:uncharacterized protein YggL (DUF469 family)